MAWIKPSAETKFFGFICSAGVKNILLSVGYKTGNCTLNKYHLGKKKLRGKTRKKILVQVFTDRGNQSQYFSQVLLFLRDTVKYFRVSCALKSLSVVVSGRQWKEFKRRKRLFMRFDKAIKIDYWILVGKRENIWNTWKWKVNMTRKFNRLNS